MDDPLREKSSTTNWRAELARSLDEHRDSARTLLAGHRERFKSLEATLTNRIDELLAVLTAERQDAGEREQDIARRELVLAQRDTSLAERLQELASRETQWSLGLREAQEKQQAWLDQAAARVADLDGRQTELRDLECRLQVEQAANARREAELEQKSIELEKRAQRLEQSQEQTAERQTALDQSREKLHEEGEQVKRQLEELKLTRAELERNRTALAEREQETQRQRRHIAQQLRARKNELVAEVELHRAEALRSSHGEELQLQIRLSELQAKYDRVREELAQRDLDQGSLGERVSSLQTQLDAREAELQTLSLKADEAEIARLEALQKAEDLAAEVSAAADKAARDRSRIQDELRATFDAQKHELTESLEMLRQERDRLQSELEQARTEAAAASASHLLEVDLSGELTRLQEENLQLQQQLLEAQSRVSEPAGDESEELADLRNRLEMAVHDVRELKSKNNELQSELSRARKTSSGSQQHSDSAALGWEAQKQRLLQQLEDFDESDEEQKVERLKIEQAIRVTDQTVAEKQQEIEELRQLLQNQSDNIGNVAVGAAAIASMLDSDELIRQERENVKGLQQELEEKLRKAEVDISVERAKLARERAEMEEKLQLLERERTQLAATYGENTDQSSKSAKAPSRGRWLARLGIQGDENQK